MQETENQWRIYRVQTNERERNPLEGLIQRKEGASDGTFVDAGAAIHLTAAFA